jgi:hypothetical protein
VSTRPRTRTRRCACTHARTRRCRGAPDVGHGSQVQKQIRILENRLDKALVKFNEALAHNKQLRETIDNLRRERCGRP